MSVKGHSVKLEVRNVDGEWEEVKDVGLVDVKWTDLQPITLHLKPITFDVKLNLYALSKKFDDDEYVN